MVQRALRYISLNYKELYSVRQVAAELGLSYHTLRSRFRREVRLTMEDFLSRTRVVQALRLMLSSDLLVKEIAWQVGYRYEEQLSRAMKKLLGRTPHVFRRQHQNRQLIMAGLAKARGLNQSN
ncbi:hypothetical protein AAU61_13720 [Desulfocarbo indianensis]|nr:hypothetical protein AAU61_13720 [Desulfocarbo indianensis]